MVEGRFTFERNHLTVAQLMPNIPLHPFFSVVKVLGALIHQQISTYVAVICHTLSTRLLCSTELLHHFAFLSVANVV